MSLVANGLALRGLEWVPLPVLYALMVFLMGACLWHALYAKSGAPPDPGPPDSEPPKPLEQDP